MDISLSDLPAPSAAHATCAWCRSRFESVVELLDHVDSHHLDDRSAA